MGVGTAEMFTCSDLFFCEFGFGQVIDVPVLAYGILTVILPSTYLFLLLISNSVHFYLL